MWPFADLAEVVAIVRVFPSVLLSRPKVTSSSKAKSSCYPRSPFINTMDKDRDEDSIMGSDLSHDEDEEEIEGRVDVGPDAAEFFQAFLGDHQDRGGGRVGGDQEDYGLDDEE